MALIDRVEANLMAGALPRIQEEFGFSDTAGGAIATAAALAGVVLLIPAGRLADRTRRTWTIAAVVAVWSVLTVGGGLAQSYATLLAVRVFLGGAGLLYNPSGSSLIADYYPGSGRARAFGLERFAYYSGLPLGIMAGGALAQAFGWRTMFFLVAVPGVVIALLCLTVREPVRGLGDRIEAMRSGGPGADAASDAPAAAAPREPLAVQLRSLLAIRTIAIPTLTAANADIVSADRRGLGFAVLQFLITLGGAARPLLVGAASDLTGSLRGAFTVLLLPLLAGTLVTFGGRHHYDAAVARALNPSGHPEAHPIRQREA